MSNCPIVITIKTIHEDHIQCPNSTFRSLHTWPTDLTLTDTVFGLTLLSYHMLFCVALGDVAFPTGSRYTGLQLSKFIRHLQERPSQNISEHLRTAWTKQVGCNWMQYDAMQCLKLGLEKTRAIAGLDFSTFFFGRWRRLGSRFLQSKIKLAHYDYMATFT